MNNLIELIIRKFNLIQKKINRCNCIALCICQNRRGFLAAVSGGPDSMGLALLLRDYCQKINEPFHAVIVDHDLRDNSHHEANYIASELNNMGIIAKVIRWDHKQINNSIQELAREARYKILSEYTNLNKLRAIFTAHHLEDQLETHIMRALNHSEIRGLMGMKEICLNKFNEFILRPFLGVKKEQLKMTNNYVIDPSNINDKFQRVRIRKAISVSEVDWESVKNQLSVISKINNVIAMQVRNIVVKYCIFDPSWSVVLVPIEQCKEIIHHVLRVVIEAIGGSIVSIGSVLGAIECNNTALGRVFLDKIDDYFLVRPDHRRKIRLERAGSAISINNSHYLSLCDNCDIKNVICKHKQCLDRFLETTKVLWHRSEFCNNTKIKRVIMEAFGRSGVFCYNSGSCSIENCYTNSRCVTNLVVARIIGDLL